MMSEEAYARQVTGKGPTFWEIQSRRVECPECGVEVTAGLLLKHLQIQNGVGVGNSSLFLVIDHPLAKDFASG